MTLAFTVGISVVFFFLHTFQFFEEEGLRYSDPRIEVWHLKINFLQYNLVIYKKCENCFSSEMGL